MTTRATRSLTRRCVNRETTEGDDISNTGQVLFFVEAGGVVYCFTGNEVRSWLLVRGTNPYTGQEIDNNTLRRLRQEYESNYEPIPDAELEGGRAGLQQATNEAIYYGSDSDDEDEDEDTDEEGDGRDHEYVMFLLNNSLDLHSEDAQEQNQNALNDLREVNFVGRGGQPTRFDTGELLDISVILALRMNEAEERGLGNVVTALGNILSGILYYLNPNDVVEHYRNLDAATYRMATSNLATDDIFQEFIQRNRLNSLRG